MKEEQTIELHFLHPLDGTTLIADVNPQITGGEALSALQSDVEAQSWFLPPLPQGHSFRLLVRRTYRDIPTHLTLEEAGVINGDRIDVTHNAQGAGALGPYWLELGEIVFWSVAAASVFLKYASPILVEFLRGRSSRSIKIRDGDYEIEITGDSSEKALDILEMLKKRRDVLDGSHVGNKDRLPSPITITLRDSKSPDSVEDDSG